jgi:hypothetical protein
MPTRFAISGELEFKDIVKEDKLGGDDKRAEADNSYEYEP